MIKITKNWADLLREEFEKDYFLSLQKFLKEEYESQTIYPSMDNIFSALNSLKFEDVKVVIIGQDPYHQPNQAHGLAFSVENDIKTPPSLANIFKEIESDLNITCDKNANLSRWQKQGVLLLNTVLTVRYDNANSHKDKGWEVLTAKIIEKLSQRKNPIVFLLWGSHAQKFAKTIAKHHLVLKAPHPSPLSSYRGFFGCKHFSQTNDFLISQNQTPINWS